MVKKYNILLVEDHALTRFALKTSLREADFIENVFEASCAQEAYDILALQDVALVVMDLGLPGINGVKATQEIKKMYKSLKVIILTSHNEEEEVIKCLEAGISAYCSKDIKPDKLIELVRDILNGNLWFDSTVSQYVLNTKRTHSPNKQKKDDIYNLTLKEKKVLSLLADGNSNQQIAKKLNISVNTTKVHVCNILQKLSVDDRTQAAIKAIKENILG